MAIIILANGVVNNYGPRWRMNKTRAFSGNFLITEILDNFTKIIENNLQTIFSNFLFRTYSKKII